MDSTFIATHLIAHVIPPKVRRHYHGSSSDESTDKFSINVPRKRDYTHENVGISDTLCRL